MFSCPQFLNIWTKKMKIGKLHKKHLLLLLLEEFHDCKEQVELDDCSLFRG